MENSNNLKDFVLKEITQTKNTCNENLICIKTYENTEPEWQQWQCWINNNTNYRHISITENIIINLCKIGDFFTQSLWLKINNSWIDFKKSEQYIFDSHTLNLNTNPNRIIEEKGSIELSEVINLISNDNNNCPKAQYNDNYDHYIKFVPSSTNQKASIEILPYFNPLTFSFSIPFIIILEKRYSKSAKITINNIIDNTETYTALKIESDNLFFNYTHNPAR